MNKAIKRIHDAVAAKGCTLSFAQFSERLTANHLLQGLKKLSSFDYRPKDVIDFCINCANQCGSEEKIVLFFDTILTSISLMDREFLLEKFLSGPSNCDEQASQSQFSVQHLNISSRIMKIYKNALQESNIQATDLEQVSHRVAEILTTLSAENIVAVHSNVASLNDLVKAMSRILKVLPDNVERWPFLLKLIEAFSYYSNKEILHGILCAMCSELESPLSTYDASFLDNFQATFPDGLVMNLNDAHNPIDFPDKNQGNTCIEKVQQPITSPAAAVPTSQPTIIGGEKVQKRPLGVPKGNGPKVQKIGGV